MCCGNILPTVKYSEKNLLDRKRLQNWKLSCQQTRAKKPVLELVESCMLCCSSYSNVYVNYIPLEVFSTIKKSKIYICASSAILQNTNKVNNLKRLVFIYMSSDRQRSKKKCSNYLTELDASCSFPYHLWNYTSHLHSAQAQRKLFLFDGGFRIPL